MLKRRISKLRLGLNSKGKPNPIKTSCRYFLQGIPVLSIFALVGIVSVSISVSDIANLSFDADSYKAYAAEADSGIMPLADTSASLTIDDGKIKDTIFTTNGEFAYATHKVSINATNIKSYTLTLAKTAGLTGPSTVNDAGTGVTPSNMDNQWGYAWINENDDPTTATYKTLNTANNLADIAIDSNHNVNASKQLVFGAKFGSSAASGTYHAEATLSLVATPRVITNYVVNVNCNSGTGCTTPLNTTSDNETYTYTISSTTPTRSGYKFLGYNTTNSTTANTNYAPGKAITLTAATPTLNLYAIWQEDIKTIKTITTMQEMYTGNDNGISSICAASTIGDTNTLTDTRDQSTYTVAKLADGKCWMTQNLRITGSRTLTSSTSDVSSNFTLPTSSLSGFSNSSVNATQLYYANNTTYGAYYSWNAATAGTGASINSGNASSSICPKGWKLPIGGTNSGDYYTLYSLYNSNQIASNQRLLLGASNEAAGGAYFPAAGYTLDNALSNSGKYALYWTRTAYSSSRSYNLFSYSGLLSPGNNDNRFAGNSVRCVAYSS